MTSSFKARFTSKEKLFTLVALFSLVAWLFPAAGRAHAQVIGQEKGLVFEIKSDTTDSQNKIFSSQNSNQIAFEKVDRKVTLVRAYLEDKNAPLANYTEILLAQPEWKKIIAISNAESNMGLHCYVNNCSGIFGYNAVTGKYGLRTYENIPAWIVDMNSLIEKRYSAMSLEKMNGIYVQPKSSNWISASGKIYNDLSKIEQQVDQEYNQA